MKYSKHFNARSIDEALSLLSEHGEKAKISAGGVDLVHLMKNKVTTPEAIINIKTIPNLQYVREDDDGLRIGATTNISTIESSSICKARYGILAEAAHSIGSPQLRNMITIAGNICQDSWCWYYRRPPITGKSFFCFRKGGKKCYAGAGDNRYHAIFRDGVCLTVNGSDISPPLIALNAKVKVASLRNERIISVEELLRDPDTKLKHDELIIEFQIPKPEPNMKQIYLKFSLRKAIDFAVASVAAVITLKENIIKHARIVLGSVAPTPHRAVEAEKAIIGETVTEGLAEKAADEALKKAAPLSMNAYKIPIMKTLIKRAILT